MTSHHQSFLLVHPTLQAQRADDLGDHRVVAVVADAHLHLVLEVDAFDLLEEAVYEMLPRLLAVADDVDAGVFLLLQPEERRVALRLRELVAAHPPRGPELVGLGEPGRLRQAAGDGGLEHEFPLFGLIIAACAMRLPSSRRSPGARRLRFPPSTPSASACSTLRWLPASRATPRSATSSSTSTEGFTPTCTAARRTLTASIAAPVTP